MKFGIGIPTCREGITQRIGTVTVDGMVELACTAERLGFHALWADDFRVPSPDMKLPYAEPPNWYEVLVSLAYIAACTRTVRIGTGVLVLPLREPSLLAKQVATLDCLSKGRFFLGVGLGVSRDEYLKVEPRQSKTHRGDLSDEILEALDQLLTRDSVSFDGQYVSLADVSLNPKPVQKPLPVYFVSLGKDSPKNMTRLARWGTGVLVSSNPEEARERIGEISELLARAGRDIRDIDVCAYGTLSLGKTRKEALSLYQGSRVGDRTRSMSDEAVVARHLIGTPADIVEKVAALAAVGVTQTVVNTFPVDDLHAKLDHLRWYGEDVLRPCGVSVNPGA
jgi:probable F420-dependent oxidoreductase